VRMCLRFLGGGENGRSWESRSRSASSDHSDTESEPRIGLVQLSADVHALSLAAKPPGITRRKAPERED